MALVPYMGTAKVQVGGDDNDYARIRRKLNQLMAEKREQPLLGLSNQGATCYMNSLLQALFMQPLVRQLIYSYTPDD